VIITKFFDSVEIYYYAPIDVRNELSNALLKINELFMAKHAVGYLGTSVRKWR